MKTHWTVLILSKEDTGIRRFKLSPLIAVSAGCVILFLAVFSAFAGYKLYHLRADISRIASIKLKNLEQSRQIIALSEKVFLLDEEMNSLRTFNRHLMGIAKVDLQTSDDLSGVGGGSEPIRAAGATEALTEKILTRELHSHIKQLGDDIVIERDVARDLLAEMERQRSLLAHTPSIWPTRGWVTSRYGWRNSPFTGKREYHKGMDIACKKGTPVNAPADGIVTSYYRNGAYGNFMVINHGYGIVTRYAHLDSSVAKPGQHVRKGDRIAIVGNTGRSTGSHLHYEVLVNGIHVNPQRYVLK
ncbi:MAG: M23 family metallopeptidase [Desulfomonilia bacterium]|nr:M23 family metallopeptidase [Desulfomonilia bacterium]HPW68996.1 M23 family metallopeptidase [Deltaproteobacteria bacterium]